MSKGTIPLTHKWILPVDNWTLTAKFIIKANKQPLVRLTQLPLADMLIHD